MIHAARNAARATADRDARCRVLADCGEALMAADATTRDWVLLAAAWQDADEPDAARHYLDHARACARGTDDRCFVAMGLFRLGDRDAATAQLAAAEATADAVGWRALATTWRHPLGDPERAQACLGHAGDLHPVTDKRASVDAIVRIGGRSVGWHRDPKALFDHLRPLVPDAQLVRIANNDYGWQADANLAELRAMCATGLVPRPLWQTLEVLQLERWKDRHDPHANATSRALACTLLLIDDAGSGSAVNEGNEATLAVLVDACLELGVVEPALGLCAALADNFEPPLVLFAELAIVILATTRDADDPRIPILLARLDEAAGETTHDWVLGLTHFHSRHDLWRMHASRVPALASRLGLHPYDEPVSDDEA